MSDQPSYTRMPNDILDAMPKLGNAELRVLLAIARKTIGWQKECDVISSRQIEDMTGLGHRHVLIALASIEEKGWITKTPAKRKGFCYQLVTLGNQSPKGTSSPREPDLVTLGNQSEQEAVTLGYQQKKDLKEKERKGDERAKRATPPPKKPKTEKAHDPTLDHLAVITYRATFKRTPNADQRQAITMAVTDNDLWSEICALWKANRWDYLKVENLINRYQKNGANNGTAHRKHSTGHSVSSAERTVSREADLDRDF